MTAEKPPTTLDIDELERLRRKSDESGSASGQMGAWLHAISDAAPELLRRARQLATAEAERDEARAQTRRARTQSIDALDLGEEAARDRDMLAEALREIETVSDEASEIHALDEVGELARAALARLKGPTT